MGFLSGLASIVGCILLWGCCLKCGNECAKNMENNNDFSRYYSRKSFEIKKI